MLGIHCCTGFSLVAVSGGFSLLWLFLWSTGSRHTGSVFAARGLSDCGSQALEQRLNSHHLLLKLAEIHTGVDSVLSASECFIWRWWWVVVVQLLTHVRVFVTPWTAVHQASLFLTISWSLLRLRPTELVMLSNHLILCHPLLLLPSIFPSIRVFSNEVALPIRWPKYWNFSFSISPSNEYSGFISFRIGWFDLLAVQGTLRSCLQQPQLKASILWRSTFFMVQLSYPYMTPGKIIALIIRTFVSKVCLCFLICYLGCHSFSSKEQASFNFMAAVPSCSDFGAQENKVCHCFYCLPIYLPWLDGIRYQDLRFLNVVF